MMKHVRPPGAEPIPVSREVFAGIEAVRRSGLTNMLDRDAVARIAKRLGFEESARWICEHHALYARAVFGGFEVVEEDE